MAEFLARNSENFGVNVISGLVVVLLAYVLNRIAKRGKQFIEKQRISVYEEKLQFESETEYAMRLARYRDLFFMRSIFQGFEICISGVIGVLVGMFMCLSVISSGLMGSLFIPWIWFMLFIIISLRTVNTGRLILRNASNLAEFWMQQLEQKHV